MDDHAAKLQTVDIPLFLARIFSELIEDKHVNCHLSAPADPAPVFS
jgi:hypothetical protein